MVTDLRIVNEEASELMSFIGVKMVRARPMTKRDFEISVKGFTTEAAEKEQPVYKEQPGYKVVYPDGYESWSPAATFEAAYFAIESEGEISPMDVARFVNSSEIVSSKLGDKTAVAQVKCCTGFEITGTSACVDPKNYDQDVGTQVALDNIKSKMWGHLGFVLQWALNGLRR